MVLAGDMDGGQMAAAVKPREHHRIAAVGLAMVARHAGDQ